MISGPARRFAAAALEPERGKIEAIDENVDNADRVVFADPVLKALRKQGALTAIRPLDKALHPPIPRER